MQNLTSFEYGHHLIETAFCNLFHSPTAYDQYIKSFLQDFYVGVVKLVDKAMKVVDTSIRGIMANEIHKHLHICVQNAKKFLGREDELYKVIICVFSIQLNTACWADFNSK